LPPGPMLGFCTRVCTLRNKMSTITINPEKYFPVKLPLLSGPRE